MRIAIADDYQDMVHRLPCWALLDGHEVTRWREPAADLDALARRLADVDIVIAVRERIAIDDALLARLPKLRLVALVGRASKAIDLAACTARGVRVATGRSNSPVSPAELTVALIIAARRNIALEARRMIEGAWPSTLSHRLRGSTLGILGLGAIGSLVAEAGKGLGMNILGWGRETSLARAREAGYAAAASQRDLFERADVLSLHVRLSRETQGLVGPADLAAMKPSALLVNTSRAELVEPGALVAALKAGRPGYAAVDVYEHEPVMHGQHPLLEMPNVLCTPHLGWAEWDNFELYFREAFEQVVAYAKGGPLRLANPEVEARK